MFSESPKVGAGETAFHIHRFPTNPLITPGRLPGVSLPELGNLQEANESMSRPHNPYGDGKAAARIREILPAQANP